jgi:hypothetical protein
MERKKDSKRGSKEWKERPKERKEDSKERKKDSKRGSKDSKERNKDSKERKEDSKERNKDSKERKDAKAPVAVVVSDRLVGEWEREHSKYFLPPFDAAFLVRRRQAKAKAGRHGTKGVLGSLLGLNKATEPEPELALSWNRAR